MHKKPCLLIFGILLFSRAGSALSDDVLAFADRLLELGNYKESITEYKRFIFFNPECEDTGYALYKMGLAYRAGRNWQEAIDAVEASILAAKDPKIADERRITLATTLIASGNYSLARLELIRVSEFSDSPPLCLKATYFAGVASLYMFDWDAAGKAFGDFYSRHAGHLKEVNSILLKAKGSYKSVRLAKLLSTFFPGAGQIYASRWRDGLNALVLNGIFIGLLANSTYKKDYTDALLAFSVLTRYYKGNIYHAELDVRKHNDSMDRRNAAKILELILEDEPK